MLKRISNRKAQNTAEYAILIALVIGAVIAMQTYLQRAMGGRILDTSKFMTDRTGNVTGKGYQYEPYYQNTRYDTNRKYGEDDAERGISINLIADTDSSKTGYDAAAFTRNATLNDYGNAL